jgi:hypothetical protein
VKGKYSRLKEDMALSNRLQEYANLSCFTGFQPTVFSVKNRALMRMVFMNFQTTFDLSNINENRPKPGRTL